MKKAFFYIAMACMVLELSYINTKSLKYLVEDFDITGRVFAIIGAVAFSMVTILVMRTSRNKWVKFIFPAFDGILMFCGFNLRFASNLLANPVAFALTLFMAVFIALITYSLGIININDTSSDISNDTNTLNVSLAEKDSKIVKLETELTSDKDQIETLQRYSADLKTQIENLKSKLKQNESDLITYRRSHLLSERSRILKKKDTNRTAEEMKVLAETESL